MTAGRAEFIAAISNNSSVSPTVGRRERDPEEGQRTRTATRLPSDVLRHRPLKLSRSRKLCSVMGRPSSVVANPADESRESDRMVLTAL